MYFCVFSCIELRLPLMLTLSGLQFRNHNNFKNSRSCKLNYHKSGAPIKYSQWDLADLRLSCISGYQLFQCEFILPPGVLWRNTTHMGDQEQNSTCFPDAELEIQQHDRCFGRGVPGMLLCRLPFPLEKGFIWRMRKYLLNSVLYHEPAACWIPTSVKSHGRRHN